jgi:uncharacterized protein YkwD
MRTPSGFKALPILLALAGCGTFLGTAESATTLNGFRAANGRSQLRADMALTAMASSHAADMARRGTLDHAGFREQRGPRGARAENVAYGCPHTACVIRQWANSSGHRRNMLISSLTRYGLASAMSASGRKYWVLMLGE